MIITSGIYKGRKIKTPDEKITRPTLSKVRMAVFNTLQSMVDFNKSTFLDMYAGSGIMGLEAISRGFKQVVCIEKNPNSANIIKSNFSEFECAPELYTGDSLKILDKINKKFDVIYIDPPYYSGINEESLRAVKNYSCGIVVLEHVIDTDYCSFSVLKQKKYGDKYITFLNSVQSK